MQNNHMTYRKVGSWHFWEVVDEMYLHFSEKLGKLFEKFERRYAFWNVFPMPLIQLQSKPPWVSPTQHHCSSFQTEYTLKSCLLLQWKANCTKLQSCTSRRWPMTPVTHCTMSWKYTSQQHMWEEACRIEHPDDAQRSAKQVFSYII